MRQIFGVPMTAGQTPREAAEGFVGEFAPIFGGEGIDLREMWVRDPGRGKTFFAYQQYIDDLPVYGSIARVMVLNEPSPRVAYAAAKVAPHPAEPLPRSVLTGPQAIEAARRDPRAVGLSLWGEPWEAVWCGEAWGLNEVVGRVWMCGARSRDLRRQVLFVVDAVTGAVHTALNQAMHFSDNPQVTGTITGYVLPRLDPYWSSGHSSCLGTPTLQELPSVLVEVVVNNNVYASGYTDDNCYYALDAPDESTPVTVRTRLVGPHWVTKQCRFVEGGDCPGGQPWSLPPVDDVLAPAVVAFLYSLPTTEPEREDAQAQTNAHYVVHGLTAHFTAYGVLPSSPEVLEVNLNHYAWHCNGDARHSNAWYLALDSDGNNCPNTAYSTLIAHEYGHFLAFYALGNFQIDAFHEGFADSVAVVFFDTDIIFAHLHGCGEHERALESPGVFYPACSGGHHYRGQVLGAIWVDILENLKWEHGAGPGLDAARTLHADWALLTLGEDEAPSCPSVPQSAGYATFYEVLMADDDDATLSNGTPQNAQICPAFCENGIVIVDDDQVAACELESCPDGMPGACCIADCDSGTGVGVLDVFDFLCFSARFEAGDAIACDCDATTGSGVCDVFDLLCFQHAFIMGCQK